MKPDTARALRWVGRILFVLSLVAFAIGWCFMAATSHTMRWVLMLPDALEWCLLLWPIPGIAGVALLFATRPPD